MMIFVTVNTKTNVAVAVTLILAAIIAVLTLMPMPQGGQPGSDKFYHVLVFALLALPLSVAVPARAIWVFLAASAYGGGIELVQPMFDRLGEWHDLGADVLGAATGALVGAALGAAMFRSHAR